MYFKFKSILITLLVIVLVIIVASNFNSVEAAVLPSGFTETRVIATGISAPTAMEFAPDGRLFVLEKGGAVRIIRNPGSTSPQLVGTPFLSLSVSTSGEQGLLGIAFDPNFNSNKFVYIYYTVPGPAIFNRVSRFTANGDVVVPGSERILLEIPGASSRHNGGAIHFGLDGKLYIAVGDYANSANSQNLNVLPGKMLRVNSDGTIPQDNPYFGQSGRRAEIWAFGLRNPFTFAVDQGTGQIFVNDVGESTWEEINLLAKAANYGWPVCEGSCNTTGFINPIYQYGRNVGSAITGGAFYRGSQFPTSYIGDYFFSDYSNSWIKVRNSVGAVSDFATQVVGAVDLKVGPDGSLYSLSIQQGIYKYSYNLSSNKPGDANGDGRVDILDFQLLANSFGKTVGQTGYNQNTDFNNDRGVDILDFQILSNNFGT